MNHSTVRTPAVPAVLDDPLRNRAVAFTRPEPEALSLTGRLPSAVLTLEQQAQRAYRQLQAQGNALLFPGLGLGTIVAGASRVTPGMLRAAAQAVADQVDVTTPGASLLPSVENLGESSAITAAAVVSAAVSDGVAVSVPADPDKAVREARWRPVYVDGTP
jgi:malic enzyme